MTSTAAVVTAVVLGVGRNSGQLDETKSIRETATSLRCCSAGYMRPVSRPGAVKLTPFAYRPVPNPAV
jgi:hypothetical protein